MLNVSMTCKRFNKVFSDNLHDFWFSLELANLPESLELTRSYKNLAVYNLNADYEEDNEKFVATVRKLRTSLRQISFKDCIINCDAFRETSNLRSLSIEDSILVNKASLPHLKELNIKDFRDCELASGISNFDTVNSLETLVIETRNKRESLWEFIAQQRNLRELTLSDENLADINGNLPSQLKTFRVEPTCATEGKDATKHCEGFVAMLQNQTKLEEASFFANRLASGSALHNKDSLSCSHCVVIAMEHVLGLQSLRKFSLRVQSDDVLKFLTTSTITNESLSEMKLMIHVSELSVSLITKLNQMFPNLKALEVNFSEVKVPKRFPSLNIFANFRRANLKSLKRLSLVNCDSFFLNRIRIDSLDHLKLTDSNIRNSDWEDFVHNHPNLKSVRINSEHKLPDIYSFLEDSLALKKLILLEINQTNCSRFDIGMIDAINIFLLNRNEPLRYAKIYDVCFYEQAFRL